MTAQLPPSYWIDQIRAQLAQARANTCGHGIDLNRGRCKDCATTTETALEARDGA